MVFTVREGTLSAYKSLIEHQIKPYFGNCPLSTLTTNEIQKFYNVVKKNGCVHADREHGMELAYSMVRKIHMLLHESLETAMRQRLIVNNPTNETTIPKNNYSAKQIVNDEQLDRFMEVIKSVERWYDFFYTELTTGLRRGEICGLRWEDFDEQNAKLKIRRSIGRIKNGVLPIGETKTETNMCKILLLSVTQKLNHHSQKTKKSQKMA